MYRLITPLALVLLPILLMGQDTKVEMADTMRSEGKIYVLVAIILVILAGLIYFVVRQDRKISRMERDWEKKS